MLSDLIRGNVGAAEEIAPATPPAVAPPKPPRTTERTVRGRFAGVSEDPLNRQRRERAEAHDLVARGAAASATLCTSVALGCAHGDVGGRIALPAGLDRAALSTADANRLREIAKGQRDGQHGSIGSRI
jgi:hypothetical protein